MLSVCIPIYNVNVSALVQRLLAEGSNIGVPYEIILIDDHSACYMDENSRLAGGTVTYKGLNANTGRARIRNSFLTMAKYDYLLFLDCDSRPVSRGFLQLYIAEAQKGERVVCGGRIYPAKPSGRNQRLHWKYGKYRESQTAQARMQHPYRSFMTNNFMIEKKLLEEIKFDERLSGYGHEDTLFGYELKKRGTPINHIANPVMHGELQSNREFLQKQEQAVANLKRILAYVNNDKAFTEDVTLLRYYTYLQKCRLLFIAKALFYIKRPFLKMFLLKGFANMAMFSFYKLGCFITG